MTLFDSVELASMRAEQLAHMQDSGKVGKYVSAETASGADKPTFTLGAEIACGFDMGAGSEPWGRGMTVVEYDARIRLPVGTNIDFKDQFTLTKQYSEALTVPILFEVVSPPQRGPSAIRVLLKRVVV